MRELKFRAWDEKRGTLAQVTDIGWDDDWIEVEDYNICLPLSKTTIEQYTGLKDKNGKEIYEGDIVLHHKVMASNQEFFGTMKCNGVVEWDDEKTGYYPFNGYDIQWDLRDLAKDVEVIGNIHENPELFGGEE